MPIARFLLACLAVLAALPAWAEEPAADSHLPIPRFVNLGANRVNLRQGPDKAQPILWVYTRNGLPVKVIGEFDTWRRIEDIDGTSGWVQSSLLSGKGRHGIVLRPPGAPAGATYFAPLRQAPDAASPLAAKVEAGAVITVKQCNAAWVEAEAQGWRGWIDRTLVWGLLPEDPLCGR